MTKFLTSQFKCHLNKNISFPEIKCIEGTCKRQCKFNAIAHAIIDQNTPHKYHSYHMFERVDYEYFNKHWKKVRGKRTTRIDKKDILDNKKFEEKSKQYLVHRHAIVSDKIFFENFTEEYTHIDYSENIQLRPKSAVQSEYFSGNQQTLHCAVLENSKSGS